MFVLCAYCSILRRGSVREGRRVFSRRPEHRQAFQCVSPRQVRYMPCRLDLSYSCRAHRVNAAVRVERRLMVPSVARTPTVPEQWTLSTYTCAPARRGQREQPEGPDNEMVAVFDMHNAGISNLVRPPSRFSPSHLPHLAPGHLPNSGHLSAPVTCSPSLR